MTYTHLQIDQEVFLAVLSFVLWFISWWRGNLQSRTRIVAFSPLACGTLFLLFVYQANYVASQVASLTLDILVLLMVLVLVAIVLLRRQSANEGQPAALLGWTRPMFVLTLILVVLTSIQAVWIYCFSHG